MTNTDHTPTDLPVSLLPGMMNAEEIHADSPQPRSIPGTAPDYPPMTRHSLKRMDRRGISLEMIRYALWFGQMVHRQGLIFHFLRRKDIPGWIDHRMADRMENLVVVVCQETGEVITCYKNANAGRNIRLKSKRLSKRSLNS